LRVSVLYSVSIVSPLAAGRAFSLSRRGKEAAARQPVASSLQ